MILSQRPDCYKQFGMVMLSDTHISSRTVFFNLFFITEPQELKFQTYFVLLCFALLHFRQFFYKMKVCGKPVSKSIGAISPTFAHFVCHILGILVIFQTPLLLHLWTVISEFGETESTNAANFIVLKKLPQPPQPQQPPPYSVSSHQHWADTFPRPNQQKDCGSLTAQMTAFFSKTYF